jgi:hypothetical protein
VSISEETDVEEKIAKRGHPKAPKVRGNILRLLASQQFTFLCNSPQPWEVPIHWCGRSLPHLQDASKCVGCKRGFPTRVVYYLHVYTYERRAWEFLELPEGAMRELEKIVGDVATLQGVRFLLRRKKGDKAHLAFELQPHNSVMQPGYVYPQEEDPEKLLRYLWGMNETKLRIADSNDLAQDQVG